MAAVKGGNKRFSIYQEEIENIAFKPNGFMNKCLYFLGLKLDATSTLQFDFYVTTEDYLRMKLFCEDLAEEAEIDISHRDLVGLLFEDFMLNIKRSSDHHTIYKKLLMRDRRPPEIKTYGEEIYLDDEQEDYVLVSCLIEKREALRLEVFLVDLEKLYPEYPFRIENILQIIYSDFVFNYSNGNLAYIMKKFVDRIVD